MQYLTELRGNVDDRIQVNLDRQLVNLRNDVTNIVNNEINHNNEAITTVIINDITNGDAFGDIRSIEAQINQFFDRVGQF